MSTQKTRLVTIDYDEYLELTYLNYEIIVIENNSETEEIFEYYKELLEDARRYREVKHDALSFTAVQRVVSDKLFDYLSMGELVGKIELFRSNYNDRQKES